VRLAGGEQGRATSGGAIVLGSVPLPPRRRHGCAVRVPPHHSGLRSTSLLLKSRRYAYTASPHRRSRHLAVMPVRTRSHALSLAQ
jgi:hypothetical protein